MQHKPTQLFYSDPERYDRMIAHDSDHLFWIAQAMDASSILELACGTGRVVIPLAGAGYNVTGIDNSKIMLDHARRKTKLAKVNAHFINDDMRYFSIGKKYDLIFIAFNSFVHMQTFDDVQDCFARVREHLAPKGKFIVDIVSPSPSLLASGDGTTYAPYMTIDSPDRGEKIAVSCAHHYDNANQIWHFKWRYEGSKSGLLSVEPIEMRVFFPQELEAILKLNGFRIAAKYGDYDAKPFDSQSERQIIITHHD